jgi:hypothetical protein
LVSSSSRGLKVAVTALKEGVHVSSPHLDYALGKAAAKRAVVKDDDDNPFEGVERRLEIGCGTCGGQYRPPVWRG